MAEAKRFRELFQTELVIIHIGEKLEYKVSQLEGLLVEHSLDPDEVPIIWEEEQEDIAAQLSDICQANGIDLLLAGALRNEDKLTYSMGRVSKAILTQAACSVLVVLEPNKRPKDLTKLVALEQRSISGYHPFTGIVDALMLLPGLKRIDYVVEVKWQTGLLAYFPMLGKLMPQSLKKALANRATHRRKSQLSKSPRGLKLSIHPAMAQPELRASHVASRQRADLLVVRAPQTKRNHLGRLLFPTAFYRLVADLPCNLLVLRNK